MRIGTAILALLMGFIARTSQTVTEPRRTSVFLVHNLQHIEMTHSKLISTLRNKFTKVDIVKTSEALTSKLEIYNHRRALYDLVIFMCPLSEKSMAIADKLNLFKYYDEGNSVLFLSDGRALQPWRILLSQFGFDVTVPEISAKQKKERGKSTSDDNTLYLNGSSRFLVDKEAIPHEKLRQGLEKGIVYEGGAITLTPYENTISWPLVQAPERLLFLQPGTDNTVQVINSNKMNLIAGAQGALTQARISVVGSFRAFSNELIELSHNDNITFLENLIDWLLFKKQVLTTRNLSICSERSGLCSVPHYIQDDEPFAIRFQLFDEDGEFYMPKEGGLYVKCTKQVLILNAEPVVVEIKGEKYYETKVDSLKAGTYKFRIIHEKPGYYVVGNNDFRIVNVIAHRITDVELFKLEGLPFLIIILTIFFSALNLMRVVLQSNNSKE